MHSVTLKIWDIFSYKAAISALLAIAKIEWILIEHHFGERWS